MNLSEVAPDSDARSKRPSSVDTAIGLLGVGAFVCTGAAVVLAVSGDFLPALACLIYSAAVVYVIRGLTKGSNAAQRTMTLLAAIAVIAVTIALLVDSSPSLFGWLGQLVGIALLMWLLWNPQARRYFRN